MRAITRFQLPTSICNLTNAGSDLSSTSFGISCIGRLFVPNRVDPSSIVAVRMCNLADMLQAILLICSHQCLAFDIS